MTSPPAPPPDRAPEQPAPTGRWRRWEATLSDWLNPILVKEARQGLKSRMFVLTFFAALLFAWSWSVLGIALMDPSLSGPTSGTGMFFGYMIILAFPLLITIPVGAYRSLANEWDDATYELMSITALHAGHIVRGKLASSLLQMLIFVSVFLPCIGFTYLLGGVSLPTMAVCLLLVVSGSVFATQFGLCLATLTRSRGLQVFFTVLFIVALLFLYWMALAGVFGVMVEAGEIASTSLFWYVVAESLAVTGAFGLVFYQATRARLTFPSENRSTGLRLALLLPPALWLGAWVPFQGESSLQAEEILLVLMPVFLYWAVVMSLIGGERGEISQRIRRRVPRSILGKMFCVWLLPGATLGYFFVVLSSGTMALVWLTLLFLQASRVLTVPDQQVVFNVLVAFWSYLVIYGGVAAWILRRVRRYVVNTLLLSLAVVLTLVVLFCVVPVFIEVLTATTIPFRNYRLIHLLNPILTGAALVDRAPETSTILFSLQILALVCIVINLRGAAAEMALLFQRTAAPAAPEAGPQRSPEPEHPFEELLAAGDKAAPKSSSALAAE